GYDSGILVWSTAAVGASGFKGFQEDRDILRSFFGNEAKVSCLAISNDATWLVSGGEDGTIAAWSLSGLSAARSSRLELGAEFARVTPAGTAVQVRSVTPVSPAYFAGLEAGDEIIKVLIAGREIAPRDWLTRLDSLVPSQELVLEVKP